MTEAFVDIWYGRLSEHLCRKAELMTLLSDDELGKARGLLREQARNNYIVSRGLLRTALAGYLCCEPRDLQFIVGEHGKPSLAEYSLAFNLSHSGNVLVLAVSNLSTVGVDVETIKPRKSMHGIAQRCFSEREFQHWQQLSPAEQISQFFRLWTIKEAFVKAVGRGIALGLEHCQVDIENPLRFSRIPAEFGPPTAWLATALTLDNQTAAALVTMDCRYELRQIEF